jgi:hypothetical protein
MGAWLLATASFYPLLRRVETDGYKIGALLPRFRNL